MCVCECSEAAIALCFGTLASGTPINLQRQIEFADGWLAVQVGSRVLAGQKGEGVMVDFG